MGDPKDALFAIVMILNIVIGVVQEWRAKSTLDHLSLVSAPKVVVWRDGTRHDVASDEVVVDDVFELAPGDQIAVDGEVLSSDGLSVDESLLTGEADPIEKRTGDEIMSGSFVTAGGGVARATAVGADSYAQRLTAEAKRFRSQKSELAKGIDQILRFITWALVPTALILYFGQRANGDGVRDALIGGVAGVVALVPQGLILLLSMAQAVAVIRLGRKQVLVQQLQAVETLARVTVLASDKTGTLTDGDVNLEEVQPLGDVDRPTVEEALAAISDADEFPNATMLAIERSYEHGPGWPVVRRIPFDSAHKYSAVDFGDHGSWYVGAPEILLRGDDSLRGDVETLAASGRRVLLLGRSSTMPPAGTLPDDLRTAALVTFSDNIRPDAAETIDYFLKENVTPKVISGDNPVTVAAIAWRCHVPNADRYVDARELPADPERLQVDADRDRGVRPA